MNALRKLQSDYPDKEKVFLGALLYLENARLIDSYEIVSLKHEKEAVNVQP